jgi:hypothetical protein
MDPEPAIDPNRAPGAAAGADPSAVPADPSGRSVASIPPPEGQWYLPQGADDAPTFDYFSDDRRLISRIISLSVMTILLAVAVTLGAMWFAAPMLETRILLVPRGATSIHPHHLTAATAPSPPATQPATQPTHVATPPPAPDVAPPAPDVAPPALDVASPAPDVAPSTTQASVD